MHRLGDHFSFLRPLTFSLPGILSEVCLTDLSDLLCDTSVVWEEHEHVVVPVSGNRLASAYRQDRFETPSHSRDAY